MGLKRMISGLKEKSTKRETLKAALETLVLAVPDMYNESMYQRVACDVYLTFVMPGLQAS